MLTTNITPEDLISLVCGLFGFVGGWASRSVTINQKQTVKSGTAIQAGGNMKVEINSVNKNHL